MRLSRFANPVLLTAAFALALAPVRPAHAQRMHGLRAAAAPVVRSSLDQPVPSRAAQTTGVSRKSLAVGAGIGALVGGIAGGVIVNNSGLSKNEAWPMFVGGGALLGALIGAGAGMAVTAFILP